MAFCNYELNIHLMKKICEEGLRPWFSFWTPDCYIELARQCMDSDPQKRPIANDIYNKLGEWIKCIEDSENSCELEGTIKQFLDNDKYENSCELEGTIKQFLDNDKYGKESSDDHKYKSKYFQKDKDSNSLLMPLP
ncbi:hypothetical protein C2G38_2310646 [Gigaspora rosea]|uniref:Serine-threonine/tyrosine-protein kinase catalytic domain-containing protein n=1 Tax=Gigaspora rosea TaxID=44941 RepID=A0A397VEH8_9GLOM|nr:hypothetical protein C2G38_2310646 [Gigaspora rosea]